MRVAEQVKEMNPDILGVMAMATCWDLVRLKGEFRVLSVDEVCRRSASIDASKRFIPEVMIGIQYRVLVFGGRPMVRCLVPCSPDWFMK